MSSGTDVACSLCGFPVDDPVEVGGSTYCQQCAPAIDEPTYSVNLRPYQDECVRGIFEQFASDDSTLAVLPTGCHAKGTVVLMASGYPVKVEHVEVGDSLMGPDSTPRIVTGLCRGRGQMYKIVPVKGEPFVVNEDHILSLIRTNEKANGSYPCQRRGGEIVDVSVKEWLGWSKWKKHTHKLFRVGVNFPKNNHLHLPAYFIGAMLGDGSLNHVLAITSADEEVVSEIRAYASQIGMSLSETPAGGVSKTYLIVSESGKRAGRNGSYLHQELCAIGLRHSVSGNKFIPDPYKYATKAERLELLAGLIDTDGHATCGGYDFISKSRELSQDVVFVARSVGLAAYVSRCVKTCQTGATGVYWRVSISGECSSIPCRVNRKRYRKRLQKKDVLRTGFRAEPVGVSDYYGFSLTGDRRYVMGDFTVTHNTGKTVIFTSVIERWQHGRMIVMAHRDELIGQAKDKIQRFTGIECDVEMGDARADQCGFYQRAPVLVTSVQTMSRPRRMERFHPEDFGLLIIDEAHHATASTYQAVINYYRQNPALKVLGVTATPDRADETALGQVFKTVAYEYQIVQAIDDGWLVPIEQQFVQVEGLDLSEIKTTAGDLNQGQLAAVLEQEKVLHGYAWPTIELSQGEQTLMFTASVDQAEKMADIFNRHTSGSAEWICGDAVKCPMDHRREVLKRFSNGDFQFLVNCGVLLEGYDEPRIKCVAVARPTKSRSLYAQIIGRGTRPLSGLVDGLGDPIARRSAIATSEKPSLLVLDFVGNSGRHKLIHTGNILGGNYPDDVVAEATRAVQGKSTKGERADMLAELRAAEERKREAARKRAQVAVKAKFQSARIDPFALWDILPKREPGWFKGKKPTQKQLDFLAKAGVPTDDLSFCQASQIIDKAIDRRKKNLCTFKQSKLLAKHGFPTEVTFTEASAIIDRIAKSGWKLMYRPGD